MAQGEGRSSCNVSLARSRIALPTEGQSVMALRVPPAQVYVPPEDRAGILERIDEA